MNLFSRIRAALKRRRRRVKVEISCPHGAFIPAAYRPGTMPRRYSCADCDVRVRLSTFRGEVTW